jgi:hypothetical protein
VTVQELEQRAYYLKREENETEGHREELLKRTRENMRRQRQELRLNKVVSYKLSYSEVNTSTRYL